jgi:hypothetical protein
MIQHSIDAAAWDEFVFVDRPRCPRCSSDDLKTTRSEQQGDGSVRRTTHCQCCGHRFFVVLE